jgi:Divergent InlB B-repeat domain
MSQSPRSHDAVPARICSLAAQIALLLSLFACGNDASNPSMTTVNVSFAVPATVAHENIGHSSWWAKLSQWLPGAAVAWAQVADIGQLKIEIFAPNGAQLATETVQIPGGAAGQTITISLKAPAGPQRRIAVSALNAAGTKLYSGKTDTDLAPGATVSVEIALAPTIEVTVSVVPSGGGTVRSSPPGLECNATCSTRFDADTNVMLSAIPQPNWSFVQWGGACTGREDCTISKTATVSAEFRDTTSRALTVTKTGPLATSGSVGSLPAGINCGSDCSESFPIGTLVSLSTGQSAGVLFSGWSGGGCNGTDPCTVTMTEDRSVSARFEAAPGYSVIEIIKTGTGTGTVASNPGGINCGSTCAAPFQSGIFLPSQITLVAAPAVGSTFGGWSGVATCSADPTCVLFVLGDQTVSAQFNLVGGN